MISPIGTLRDRVSILVKSASEDTQGGRTVPTWVDLITGVASRLTRFPANVTPRGSGERIQASSAIGADQSYQIEMRYLPTAATTMRVLWTPYRATNAKTLEIRGVQAKDGMRDAMLLDCSELNDAAA